jgi:hypothetical protein
MKAIPPKPQHAFACSKFLCLICVCATICFVAYRLSLPGHSRHLWYPVVVEANGTENIVPNSRQLEFWTPSAKTAEFLRRENSEIIDTEKWAVISNEDTVVQFGYLLRSNTGVLGYRRVEVWGQGRTGYKPGWWWSVNVLTNYNPSDLGMAYQEFWKSHQAVFVEVIDNRGHDE